MGNLKAILALLAIIAVLAAADVALVFCNRGFKVSERTVLVDAAMEVDGLAIERRGEKAVVLEKTGTWKLVEPYSGSADTQVVMRLLDQLTFTRVIDVISDPAIEKLGHTRADFSLDDPLVRVTVRFVGKEDAVLSFGSATASGDGVYVAIDDVEMIYVMPFEMLAAVDLSADNLRRRSLFDVGYDMVSAFDIRNGRETATSFERDGENWISSGQRTSSRRVKDFLSDLLTAEAIGFVWPTGVTNELEHASAALLAGYGLDHESAVTVVLRCGDGRDRQISFGKAFDDGRVYALAQNAGAIVTVAAALKDAAVQEPVNFTDSHLFPVEGKSVVSFTVVDADTVCAFARTADGIWRLESPITAAADQTVVNDVLSRILALTSADLDGNGVQVSIATNASVVTVSRPRVLGDLAIERFRSAEMFALAPEMVKRIVKMPGGKDQKPSAVVYDRERRAWNVDSSMVGGTVRPRGVERVLAALNPLTARRVERIKVSAAELDDYGLDKPYLTVAIDSFGEDAVRRNIIIGGETKGAKGERYATVGASDAVFVLPGTVVESLASPIVDGED